MMKNTKATERTETGYAIYNEEFGTYVHRLPNQTFPCREKLQAKMWKTREGAERWKAERDYEGEVIGITRRKFR